MRRPGRAGMARARRPASRSGWTSRRRPPRMAASSARSFTSIRCRSRTRCSATSVSEDRAVSRLPLSRAPRHRRQEAAARSSPRATSTSSSGRNYLVTVHDGTSRSIARLREVCDQHERILAEGPVALLHRIVDSMVDNYRPVIEAARGAHRAAGGAGVRRAASSMVRQVLEAQARPGVDAPGADPAARRHRPPRPARVPGDRRRDGVPLPRRLRPRRAADGGSDPVPGPRHRHPRGATWRPSRIG